MAQQPDHARKGRRRKKPKPAGRPKTTSLSSMSTATSKSSNPYCNFGADTPRLLYALNFRMVCITVLILGVIALVAWRAPSYTWHIAASGSVAAVVKFIKSFFQ